MGEGARVTVKDGGLWAPGLWVNLSGNNSALHITDPGSSLVTGEVLLNGATPTLTVENQGRFNLNFLNLQKGTTLVSGAGSDLTIRHGGQFVIGRNGAAIAGRTGAGTLMVKDGGAVVSHAALELTSQMDYSAYVVIDSGSSVTLNKGLSSKIGGAVDIQILNGGSLISKSSATFGKPDGDDGKPTTLLVDGDGSRWSHSDGEFKLHHKASLRLANRGALDLGGQPLHLAGKHSQIIIGGGPDDEAQAGGTLTAGQLVFSSDASKAGTQKLVFNHIPTEAGLDFSPALSGNGKIEHKQGHTILSGHSEQFAGSTTVTGGILVVTGKLGGTVDVKAGGALGGTGTLSGKTTVYDGGTLHVASQGMAFNDDLTCTAPWRSRCRRCLRRSPC